MNKDVVITCAVTGAGDTAQKSPHVPVTPKQIANSVIDAAKAGAAIAHIHVRDPATGLSSRDPALYREVVARVRESDTDVVLNLTGGLGGDYIVDEADLSKPGPGSDLVGGLERIVHAKELSPEIVTLDCGTMNFGDGKSICIYTPDILRDMARHIQGLGIRPEMEIFDTGHLRFAKQLIAEGLIDAPPLFQLCLGIAWGAGADTASMKCLADQLPDGANWTGFGISQMQMPMVAQSILLGGNVRVGLEDSLYLGKGVLATNAQLVEHAVKIINLLGARVLGPDEARNKFNLGNQATNH